MVQPPWMLCWTAAGEKFWLNTETSGTPCTCRNQPQSTATRLVAGAWDRALDSGAAFACVLPERVATMGEEAAKQDVSGIGLRACYAMPSTDVAYRCVLDYAAVVRCGEKKEGGGGVQGGAGGENAEGAGDKEKEKRKRKRKNKPKWKKPKINTYVYVQGLPLDTTEARICLHYLLCVPYDVSGTDARRERGALSYAQTPLVAGRRVWRGHWCADIRVWRVQAEVAEFFAKFGVLRPDESDGKTPKIKLYRYP
eukprot:2496742-Rhodomonas_salina.1